MLTDIVIRSVFDAATRHEQPQVTHLSSGSARLSNIWHPFRGEKLTMALREASGTSNPIYTRCDFRVLYAWAESGQGDRAFSVALRGRPLHNLEAPLGATRGLFRKRPSLPNCIPELST